MSTLLIPAGTTDVSVTIRIVDATDGTPETGVVFNTSGIDLWYRREGAVSTDITEADLTTPALTDAHADGGFLHINDGWYRLDLPDAACASGVRGVQIGGTVTGMVVLAPYIQLIGPNIFDSVRMGLTALPNAAADAAGGLVISDAGGLNIDGVATNISDILTDTGTTLPATLADILADTGTDIPALIAALNDLSASDVRAALGLATANLDTQLAAAAGTTQISESYAANGVAPTRDQALLAIHQMLFSMVISGAVVSIKKLDQSTEAFTAALNDSATPSSILRT